METILKLILALVFLGAAQGIFLGVALWSHKQGVRAANRILSVLLIVIALLISNFVFCETEAVYQYPHFANLHVPLLFLCGPLFYLYAKALTTPGFRLSRSALLHGVPAVLCALYLIPYFLEEPAIKLEGGAVPWWFLLGLLCLHLFGYLAWVIVRLTRHAENIKQLFSSSQRVGLAWLRNLTTAVLVVWMVLLFVFITGHSKGPVGYIIPLLLSVIVYAIGYMGFRQPEIFSGVLLPSAASPPSPERYATSTLTADQADLHLDRLHQLMEGEKPYLDPNLTLPELADRLSISTHHLSQVINQRLGQNFFDFVNRYRVEEAKQRLADPHSAYLTILAIANEAGFNSKSAFYTAFRKHAGMTPSQYKRTAPDNPLAA